MKNLRKALVISVMFAMVLSMGMTVAAPKANAASGGDLIKMDGLSSVYYLGTDGKRYVFPNEHTYFSWYSDFSTVVTIPQSELESYPLGANVTMRPGTKLVKITTDPKVYAVEPDGELVHVPSEDTAKTLWGDDWADRVVDVPDAFFTNYTVTSDTVSAGAYPTGSLVKWEGSADVYYIESDGTARKIQDEAAFTANKFSWDDIVVASIAMPAVGTAITAFDVNLFDPSAGAGGVPGAGTGLTVSLASDTPASMNIPEGSPAEFLKFNVTASADGEVKINSLSFRAYDLGDADEIDDVTTYVDGVKKGTAKDMNDRVATINYSDPIVVPAGESKSISVKATFDGGTVGNYGIGLAAATSITTNGAVVSGSFPIVGNSMAQVSGGTIGTVVLSGVDDADNTGVEFGEDNVKLAGFNLVTTQEPIIWESARFRNGGTSNDIADNVIIFVDGVEVATGEWDGDYVVFNMNNYVIAKNDTVSVEIYGDMGTGNVGDSVTLYVKEASDFSFVGQEFGYGIQMTNGLNTIALGKATTLAVADFIMDMDKAATPAIEVRPGTDDVVLATLKLTSVGEDATIDSIADAGGDEFIISGTGLTVTEITNVEMVDTDSGTIYTISETFDTDHWELSMTEEISLAKGVTKTFHIRADLSGASDSTPIDDGDTLQVTLEDGAFTVTGDTSNDDLSNDITPTSVNSSIITVETASLTWTTTQLSAKSVVPGAEDVVIYRANLKAGNASDVTLSAVRLDSITSGTSLVNNNISQLTLKLNGQVMKTESSQISSGGSDAAYISFPSLTTNNKIPAGETYVLDLVADFSSDFGANTGEFRLGLENNVSTSTIVVRNSDNDTFNETVSNVDVTSRTMTLAGVGNLTVELKTDDSKADVDTYILAGTETTAGRYMGELVFTTSNEPIKVQKLALGNTGDAGASDISAVRLYDKDGNMVAQEGVSSDGHVYFDSLNLIMPADQATSYFIGVVTKTINADGDAEGTADYGNTIKFRMATTTDRTALGASETIKVLGVNSGTSITMSEANGVAGTDEFEGSATTTKEAKIVGAVLTSIVNDLSDGVLTGGTNRTIAKYKFTFNNGSNRTDANAELKARMHTLDLAVASSSGVSVSAVQAYIEGQSSIKAAGTETAPGVWQLALGNMSGETEYVDGTVTLVITATIDGVSTGKYVSTEISDLANGDFVYNGDNSTTDDLSDTRLDYTEVIGGTLSN